MSIRERIDAIAKEMLADPTPAQVREFEIELAALLWGVNKEVTRCELAFKRDILEAESKTAAGKRQIAEGNTSYAELLEAEAAQKSVMEMLRTCRSHGRSLSEEMRLQR